MKRRAVLLLTAMGAALLLATGVALAASQLDQQNQPPCSGFCPIGFINGFDDGSKKVGAMGAQTFTAGMTGGLDKVRVYLRLESPPPPDDEVRASIQPLDGSGHPAGINSAGGAVGQINGATLPTGAPDWVEISFSQPALVEAGTKYALVMDTTSPSGSPEPGGSPGLVYSWFAASSDPYAGGFAQLTLEDPSSSQWQWRDSPQDDFFFQTFVDPDIQPPSNQPPVAANQAVETNEDTAKEVTLGATDTDGDPLTYNVVAGPTHGDLSGSGQNLTYTPDANYSGPDSFTFKANDGTADSNIATVAITINPVNDAPVAVDDEANTDEDTATNINVASNDTDVDTGDSPSVSSFTQPSHGTVTQNSDGTLKYEPVKDYNGSDSFTYKAKDSSAVESNSATVTITINSVNDAPVAKDDSGSKYSVAYNGASKPSLNVSQADGVLANDTDVDNANNELTAVLVNDASKGSLTLNKDGSFTYTPKAENFNGNDSFTDTFTYKVKDPGGTESNIATVTISVGRACSITGTTGNDSGGKALAGATANEVLCGLTGDDTIRGDGGNDLIFGDGGKDTLKGENGDDFIVAKDGVQDTIDCGKGSDTVLSYDVGVDKLANNCENKLPQG